MMRAKIANLANIHETMAAAVCNGKDRKLRCRTCGHEEDGLTQADIAECLRSGWPECHGSTMELV